MFQRRIAVLLIISLLTVCGLGFRLFKVSVVDHRQYVAAAELQQTVEKDVLPRRGVIYGQDTADGKTVVLAESVQSYALSATPANVTKKEAYAHVIAQFAGVDEAQLLATFKANGQYMPPIKHGLTKDQIEQLAARLNAVEKAANPAWTDVNPNFDADQGGVLYFIGGVFFELEFERVYPEGSLAAQALGFVNDSGEGQYGFEGQYNSELKGYSGKVLLEQDSLGTLLNQSGAVKGEDGTSYELTVDRNVQYEVEQELAAEVKKDSATSGSVIVMDPKTGGIIAMASTPTYDPNSFRDVSQQDIGVFDNPTISDIWEPGSIFKPLVMAAALDTGVVDDKTVNTFPESVTVQGHKIETALRHAYGTENMAQVLANSDNVAMVWVADKLGNQNMYDYLKKFGFGSFTGIDLKNEAAGDLRPGSQWSDIRRSTISFGQGIAVTPLQVITAYAAIANDGRMVQPHMVQAIIDPNGARHDVQPVYGEQVIKPETSKTLRDMMVYTVQFAHNRAGTPGYKIGGKTGTAQIPDPVNGGYIPDAYNHSFVGIGPSDDPKYVVLVKIDHPDLSKVGTFAESTAVPLFGRISTFLLNYYQIPPTNR